MECACTYALVLNLSKRVKGPLNISKGESERISFSYFCSTLATQRPKREEERARGCHVIGGTACHCNDLQVKVVEIRKLPLT